MTVGPETAQAPWLRSVASQEARRALRPPDRLPQGQRQGRRRWWGQRRWRHPPFAVRWPAGCFRPAKPRDPRQACRRGLARAPPRLSADALPLMPAVPRPAWSPAQQDRLSPGSEKTAGRVGRQKAAGRTASRRHRQGTRLAAFCRPEGVIRGGPIEEVSERRDESAKRKKTSVCGAERAPPRTKPRRGAPGVPQGSRCRFLPRAQPAGTTVHTSATETRACALATGFCAG